MIDVKPFIDEGLVRDFFSMLNDEKIEYALIKNISGELPLKLKNGKDIDILVKPEDKEKISFAMKNHGWLYRVHPLGREAGWTFAYGLPEYQFWQLGNIPQSFYVDACFRLMCKSLTPRTWVPLNEPLQQKAWTEREWNDELRCWQLGEKTLFIYLFVRCVFDKRTFSPAYIAEIEKRKNLLDDDEVRNLLGQVFYKFTPRLIELARRSSFDSVIGEYIRFQDY